LRRWRRSGFGLLHGLRRLSGRLRRFGRLGGWHRSGLRRRDRRGSLERGGRRGHRSSLDRRGSRNRARDDHRRRRGLCVLGRAALDLVLLARSIGEGAGHQHAAAEPDRQGQQDSSDADEEGRNIECHGTPPLLART
jgi:hypothetical protein